MKKYNNYIIKTTKTTVELTKYVRDYYQRQFKALMTPFWKTINDQPDAVIGAKNIRDYILKCRDASLENEPKACFAGLMINFICNEILGAYSNAFSSAFEVAHLCSPVPEPSYPFELKIWATTEPTLYNAKKNITALDDEENWGPLFGDDSQIEKIDNGDGTWTFRSSDVVEWFSFLDFDIWDYDTKITKIDVINLRDVKTLYESFAGLASMTDIIFMDLSMTKDIQSFCGVVDSCTSLTAFPEINTSSGTNFNGICYRCESLTSFPLIDTSSGIDFSWAWAYCSSLTSFPSLNVSSGADFNSAWYSCTSLSSCPGTDGTVTIPDGATTTDMCLGI